MVEPVETAPVPRRARFLTLGCKVSQYDAEVIRERAADAGCAVTDEDPDVVVVTTCAVTAQGQARSLKAVRRMAREHPRARIYVTGCGAALAPEAAAALPRVAAVVPPARRDELLDLFGGRPDPAPAIERRVRARAGRARAFVKVQDGCPLRCAYCIVPLLRPAPRSKRPDTVVAEIATLERAGYPEVVLTGIHLGAYGPPGALAALVRRVLRETGLRRLRLSSLECSELDAGLLEVLASEPRLAPHLHLPLQSGSPRVLAAMRRRTPPAGFLDAVAAVRTARPGCAVTTDVIAGFPGETEEDFEATLSVLTGAGVAGAHVFPFSPRPGTPAAGLPGRVDPREIRRRAARAEAVVAGLSLAARQAAAGRDATVAVEFRRRRGFLHGRTEHGFGAYFDGEDSLMGHATRVTLAEPFADGLRARPVAR
ncbi:MAG: MiaB/RimO family radical SAM methylthiotransferase [Planctomycetes bacterium]|jgi:threonylcarbamoyladenosine tRNA methylthiotransferase MtaB|nr:MiaB/RimO family radical SAM methylthiotransferase [Planctomycetota bacterium]